MIKRKLSPEEKITAVELYLNGVQQLHTIVEHYGIAKESFRTWVRNYQIFGQEGLRDKHKQTSYSTEIQTAAVRDYLSGFNHSERVTFLLSEMVNVFLQSFHKDTHVITITNRMSSLNAKTQSET